MDSISNDSGGLYLRAAEVEPTGTLQLTPSYAFASGVIWAGDTGFTLQICDDFGLRWLQSGNAQVISRPELGRSLSLKRNLKQVLACGASQYGESMAFIGATPGGWFELAFAILPLGKSAHLIPGPTVECPNTHDDSFLPSSLLVSLDQRSVLVGWQSGSVTRIDRSSRGGDGRHYTNEDMAEPVTALAAAPSGVVLLGFADGSLAILRGNGSLDALNSGDEKPHQEEITSIALAPDASAIAVGSRDGVISLWSSGGTLVWTSTSHASIAHTAEITEVAWHPLGAVVASASRDCTVRLFSRLTGREFATLVGHEAAVTCVAWNPVQPAFLISADESGRVLFWDLSDALAAEASARVSSVDTAPRSLRSDHQRPLNDGVQKSGESVRHENDESSQDAPDGDNDGKDEPPSMSHTRTPRDGSEVHVRLEVDVKSWDVTSRTHSGQILVLVDGKVVEQGSHEELLAFGGVYTRLWRERTGSS